MPIRDYRTMRIVLYIVVAMSWCAAAMAQPADVSRVLRTIDFEERRLGNNEDLPMHWLKVEGDGLPAYVNGKLTNDRAHGGTWSFRLDLDGGCLSIVTIPTKSRCNPAATIGWRPGHRPPPWLTARRITAYFTDRDEHPLPATIAHSELYAATDDQVAWKQLQVELTAADPRAAYLAIELELIQPRFFQTSTLGNRAIFHRTSTDRPGLTTSRFRRCRR